MSNSVHNCDANKIERAQAVAKKLEALPKAALTYVEGAVHMAATLESTDENEAEHDKAG